MKIGWAVLVGMMILTLLPRVREMVKNSPKGSPGDWLGVAFPIALVVGFVALLILLV